MKLLGTLAQIGGVFLLSSRLGSPWLAFATMTVGSVAWIIVAVRMRDRSLVAINIAFTLTNLLGIWRWHGG